MFFLDATLLARIDLCSHGNVDRSGLDSISVFKRTDQLLRRIAKGSIVKAICSVLSVEVSNWQKSFICVSEVTYVRTKALDRDNLRKFLLRASIAEG